MLRYVVSEEHRRIRAADYLAGFVDVPRFHGFCRACPCYGRNWACPEFDFDPALVWTRYRWLHLIAYRMEFEPDQPRTGFDHAELVAAVREMFRQEKRRAHRRLMQLRTAVPGSYPIGAGECDLCGDCTRVRGLPCRLPEQLVYSIESLGGDIEATMRLLFGHPVQWSDGASLPDHYLLVAGLLCDREELPHL